MNNAWNDYVALVMSKEMLAEAGETEPNIIYDKLSGGKGSLFWNFTNDLAPDFENKELLNDVWKLVNKPVEDQFLHYSGKITGPFGAVCKYFEVTVNGERQRIAINDCTKLQKNYFTEREELHVFAEAENDALVARYVLTDSAVAAMQYFPDTKLGSFAMNSFLKLSSQKQAAYGLLATNKNLRRSMLYALAYFSTKAIAEQSFSADMLCSVAEEFNSTVCMEVNCDRIKPSLFALYAQDLYGSKQVDLSTDAFLLQVDFSFNKIKKLLPLSFFAIIGGFSAWHKQGLSTTQIIAEKLAINKRVRVAEALNNLAHPKLVNSVLTEIIDAFPDYPDHADAFNDIFFEVIKRCKCLSGDMICRLSDILFSNTIYQEQSQHMYDVLSGPNGEFFRNHIMGKFSKACEDGLAEFHFCAAAITNAERHHASQKALDAAIEGISDATTTHDYLLNALCLGMLAWDGNIGGHRYTKEIVGLKLDDAIVSKFVSYLATPDKLFFPIIASTVHDLVLMDVLSSDILGEPQRLAALQALEDEDIRKRAEELLSLIKVPDENCTIESSAEPLRRRYLERYEACHKDPQSDDDCEVLLAVLYHLGEFPTLAEKKAQLDRVLLRSTAHQVHTSNCNKWRIGHLVRSVCLRPQLWGECTTNIDPAILDQELTENKKQELTNLSNELANANRKHRVSDTQEAVEIIKFLAPYTYDVSTQKHLVLANLVKHIIMDVPNPGSFIITNWFGILCRYASPEHVLAYYRTYREVLDRPVSMLYGCRTNKGNKALYTAYRTYMLTKPRVSEGIYSAVINGNLDVLSAFLGSEFSHLVDNQHFADSLLKDSRISGMETRLVSIYEKWHGKRPTTTSEKGRHEASTVCIEALIETANCLIRARTQPKEDSEFPWMEESSSSYTDLLPDSAEWSISATRYYDDLAIQRYTILKKPENTHLVMMLGYCDDYDLMKHAVSVNGELLKHATQRLQEDNEICLIALQQTGLALPYVKGSIREETETVTPLLLASECVLAGIPKQYCENPDIVMKAVLRDPTQLQHASDSLRADRNIVAAAILQEEKKDKVPSVVKWVSETLRDDKALMIHALKTNPQAYTYLSPRLRNDPDILAMEHCQEFADMAAIMEEIRRMLGQL